MIYRSLSVAPNRNLGAIIIYRPVKNVDDVWFCGSEEDYIIDTWQINSMKKITRGYPENIRDELGRFLRLDDSLEEDVLNALYCISGESRLGGKLYKLLNSPELKDDQRLSKVLAGKIGFNPDLQIAQGERVYIPEGRLYGLRDKEKAYLLNISGYPEVSIFKSKLSLSPIKGIRGRSVRSPKTGARVSAFLSYTALPFLAGLTPYEFLGMFDPFDEFGGSIHSSFPILYALSGVISIPFCSLVIRPWILRRKGIKIKNDEVIPFIVSAISWFAGLGMEILISSKK